MMLSANKTIQFVMHCTMQFVTTVFAFANCVLRKVSHLFLLKNKIFNEHNFSPTYFNLITEKRSALKKQVHLNCKNKVL